MNLAKLDARGAWRGALLGALSGFLLGELGLRDIVGGLQSPSAPIFGLFLGFAFGLFWKTRILEVAAGLLAIIYLFVVCSFWMARAAPRWVRADPVPSHLDAVVVLSASVGRDSALSFQALTRLLTGVELSNRVSARWFVTTRVRTMYARNEVNSDFDQNRTISLTKLQAQWLIADSVTSTRGEAVRSWAMLAPLGAKNIAVVTTPMHTRRACATFEKVGFAVTCVPAHEHDVDTWRPHLIGDRIAAFRDYTYERIGMIKYRWKGWLPSQPGAAASR